MKKNDDMRALVMSKVSIREDTGCWIWTAGKGRGGYGKVWIRSANSDRVMKVAHRAVYELRHGKIPKGLQLDHLCRVRECVNPSHLEPVTPKENIRRGETGKWESAKTHCPYGHPYDSENTWVSKTNNRKCRACKKLKYKAKARFEEKSEEEECS